MADYDWSRGCCSATVGFPHDQFCKENPKYAFNMRNAELRTQGYHWNGTGYECRRGCGTLVWDTKAHSENVCREFHPVAG